MRYHLHLNSQKFLVGLFPIIILFQKNLPSAHRYDIHLKIYINNDHGHIITGGLNIIQHFKFQKLMKSVLNFDFSFEQM